ncbi:unnamed protein product [Blepharisma stoltei]|uniref:ATP synthase F0 subunit 8 n=1 Tax=Blepharisma stoltei TaxID=1481888 RepID=A0AAU9IV59_9CILI|nr:unnamed protein product [Blepharisma stoltei]
MEIKEELSICSTEDLEIPPIVGSDNNISESWMKWAILVQSILILFILYLLVRIDSRQSHVIELLKQQQEQLYNFTSTPYDSLFETVNDGFWTFTSLLARSI